jgi:hypothetical protein
MTTIVTYTFSVSDTTQAAYSLVLSKTNRIGDTKFTQYLTRSLQYCNRIVSAHRMCTRTWTSMLYYNFIVSKLQQAM